MSSTLSTIGTRSNVHNMASGRAMNALSTFIFDMIYSTEHRKNLLKQRNASCRTTANIATEALLENGAKAVKVFVAPNDIPKEPSVPDVRIEATFANEDARKILEIAKLLEASEMFLVSNVKVAKVVPLPKEDKSEE